MVRYFRTAFIFTDKNLLERIQIPKRILRTDSVIKKIVSKIGMTIPEISIFYVN